MEKVFIAKSRTAEANGTVIAGTRYGNVLASRGSVVPLFIHQVMNGEPITITDPRMTRFVMTLDEAVQLCLDAFEHGRNGDLFVQKAPAVTIADLARAVLQVMNRRNHAIRVIGTRHGEKRSEILLSREEKAVAEDCGAYYRVAADNRDLNYDSYFSEGEERVSQLEDFSSENTRRLGIDEMAEILRTLPFVRSMMRGETADAA
jgi:UDP-glucose 4-epimerase